ncbi:MAG TPA: transposase [Myxococcaceae bacterium]|nr:transposase [Myxococcaceae bacterium]
MGWPLRMFEPLKIYFVTVRCFQRRLLMRPSSETNEVLGGVLARAVRMHGVEVFGFVFASNHVHLLVRAPKGNLPRFMQHLLTNVSKKVGNLVRWKGRLWERRYSAEPVLDEIALLGRVRYMLAHGPKEGLVRTCAEWPGLSSLKMMVDGSSRGFRWFNWTRRAKAHRPGTSPARFDVKWAEQESLALTPLPLHTLQSREALRRFLQDAMRAIETEASVLHRRFLGRAGVLRQSPHRKARQKERSSRPPCHTSSPAFLKDYLEVFRAFVAAFRQASTRWKRGELNVAFPEGAFRPFVWPRAPSPQLAA